MGMKTLIFAVIPFLLAVFSPAVFADEPSWVSPDNSQFRDMPESDRIIPLGFSKKGVFSYILQQNSCRKIDGNDQYLFWIAVDLVDDKVLKQVTLGMESPHVSAEDILQKYRKVIEDSNVSYGISMEASPAIISGREVQTHNDLLTITMELTETVDGEDAVNPGYRKYKLSLLSKKKGGKILAHIISVYNPLSYWGYIKSPFEERIAALFISDFRGCDAFPQMRINIVGANLVSGFE